MSSRPPPQRVPTLTEVIEVPEVRGAPEAPLAPVVASEPVVPRLPDPPEPALAPLPSAEDLTARVFEDVQRQVELMLEHRLREALMPAVLRATDSLAMDVRTELASTLHELVARAVEQALAAHRQR